MKNEPDSVNLFDFGCPVPLVTHEQRIERLKKKKAEKREPSQHRRASNPAPKSGSVELSVEKSAVDDDIRGESIETDKVGNIPGRKNSARKRKGCTDSDESGVVIGISVETKRKRHKNDGAGNGSVDTEIQGSGTERKSKSIDLSDFNLSEFPVSNKILSPRQIEAGPSEPDNDYNVEIVIDGNRYKVSKWSVNGNVYTQGLDSNYLTHKYKV